MNKNHMPKIKKRSAKRIGRGPGSGKGKTGGKGTKGQNVRGKLPITHSHYEGGQRPLIKRLPYRRGKKNKSISKKPIVVNIKALNALPKNSQVNTETLIKFGIVRKSEALSFGVKILGSGELQIPLVIELSTSKSASQKIEKAGGKILKKENKKKAKKPGKKVIKK